MLDYHHWNDADDTTPQPHASNNAHSHYTFPYDTFLHPDPFYDCTPCYHQSTPIPIASSDGGAAFLVSSKGEEAEAPPLPPSTAEYTAARLGLNLGGRTYFSSADDELVRRMYNSHGRPCSGIIGFNSSNTPRCQAEGCYADLTGAKHYHRRHKVCEYHSKAATVFSAGITQRFCQQCSRFHPLQEFDNGKRSCRKRLADHNRRRRKFQQQQQPLEDGKKQGASSSFSSFEACVSARSQEEDVVRVGVMLECFGGRGSSSVGLQ